MEASVVIARPVAEVWEYLSKAENLPVWVPVVDEVTQITAGPLAVGTRWRGVARFLGIGFTALIECTRCELNKAVEFKSVASKLVISSTATFDEVHGGTRFTYRTESKTGLGRTFGKLTSPIVSKASSRALQASLENLVKVLSADG
jgi:uncharacterized membrane protein